MKAGIPVTPEKKGILRRYTDIAALLYLLRKRSITLLNPGTWDDGNDAHYLRLYRRKKKLKSVLAICFTQASETYHHWRVFAAGGAGVCIQFKRDFLVNAMTGVPGLRMGSVRYLKIIEIRTERLRIAELPFLKRYPFQDENEYRAIYESGLTIPSFDIAIPLTSIDFIALSPWMPSALVPHVTETIRAIDGCANLHVYPSTLIGNEEWKNLGEGAS